LRTNRIICLAALFWGTVFSFDAFAQVKIGSRSLMTIKTGVETLRGSYVFGVENYSDSTQETSIEFRIPTESSDWGPEEGATPEEIKLGDDGKLVLQKSFPPGLHLVSIGFLVKAPGGSVDLTLDPVTAIGDMTILYPKSETLELSALNLTDQGEDGNAQNPYRAFVVKEGLEAGKKWVLTVSGIHKGRSELYKIGAAFAILMLICAVILGLKTRPHGVGSNDLMNLASK